MLSDWSVFIDAIKQEKGLSSAELAKSLGVRPQLLNDIEKGRSKNPSSDFLIRLIHRIGLNPNYLAKEDVPLFLTKENDEAERENEIPSIKVHNSERFKDKNLFEIPFLTHEEAQKFDPHGEIPHPKSHSGDKPDYDFVLVPERLLEYSTDLRAFEVFDSQMFPAFKYGDIAIMEATGWNGNGIYLYRMSGGLHISYAGRYDGSFHLFDEAKKDKEGKEYEELPYDPQTFQLIGRVRAVVKDLFGFDWKKGTLPPRESWR